jgi:N-methylhydantoinase A/oxoprolinase/acetone carboxylase beta subunit
MNRINPEFFLGGKMKLRADLAAEAIKKKIADPMGFETVEAAEAICNILDGKMESLLRTVMALRGLDPVDCPLFAFGGMGPTHCAGYSANLNFNKVIISPHASIFSALGAATADVRHRYEMSPFSLIRDIPYDSVTLRFLVDRYKEMSELPLQMIDRFNTMFEDIDKKATEDMFSEGFSTEEITKNYEIEARYGGQLWEVRYRTRINRIETLDDFAQLVIDFEQEYIKQYGNLAMVPRGGIEIIGIAVVASASPIKPSFRKITCVTADPSHAFKEKRNVFFNKKWLPTNVYGLEQLDCGNIIEGPAIIEGIDTNVVLPADRKMTVDEYGNLVIEQL